MSQNVMIAGALFEDVPSIKVPDSNNVYHSFLDTSDATATAANILQGYTAYVNGELITGTASRGVTNVVTGTFTGTTGGALTVPLNYNGSGYPLAAIIFPTEGAFNREGDFYKKTDDSYAFGIFAIAKSYPNKPTYRTSGDRNKAAVGALYKITSSSPPSMGWNGVLDANTFSSSRATASYDTGVRFKSATEMSVFISSGSYGFSLNIPYTYCVLYSS